MQVVVQQRIHDDPHMQTVHNVPTSLYPFTHQQVRDLVLLASADGRRPHVYLPQDCRPHADKFISVLIEKVRVLLFFPLEASLASGSSSGSGRSSGDSSDGLQSDTETAANKASSASFSSRNKTLTTHSTPEQQQKTKESSSAKGEARTNIEYIDRYEDIIESEEETRPDRPDVYQSRLRKLR